MSPGANVQHLRIAWVGFHVEGLPALRAVLDGGTRVEAVITLVEERLTKRSGFARYDDLCDERNVPLYKVRSINDPATIELLRNQRPDVVFVIGWSEILRREVLGTARIGFVGAHAAMLPSNRGSAPVNWAILRGETETGNTLMWLGEEVDQGDIIDQMAIPITPYDTCGTIYGKVAETNREMIVRLLSRLAAGDTPRARQPSSDEPLLPRRRPEDGAISWGQTSREVFNFIRALTRPYPGAFSWLEKKRYLIWDAALLPGDPYPHANAGEVLGPAISPHPCMACGQVVACGQGALVLLEMEAADGTILKGKDLSELAAQGKVWSNA